MSAGCRKPSPRLRQKTRPGQTLFLALLLTLVCGTAGAESEDLPRLKQLFNLQDQRADYVLVVDTSKSMRPLWPAVKDGLRTFVRSLPEGDSVSFVFFADEASNTRILPRKIAEGERAILEQEVLRLGAPDGQWTDLGRALDKAVVELSRPGANRLQFVFLLSDFAHDPAKGSPFAERDPSGAQWSELASRRRLAGTGRISQTFALLLPIGSQVGRDLRLVETVLGPTEAVNVTAATLEAWFERRRAEIERDKLRILIGEEIAHGWSAEIQPSRHANRLTIRSAQQVLSLVVAPTKWETGDFDSVEQGREVNLPPKASIGSDLVVIQPAPANLLRRILTTRHTREGVASIRGRISATAEPADEIRRLGINPESQRDVDHEGPSTILQQGTAAWLQAALALLLLAASVFSWRTWLRPRSLLAWHFRRIAVSGSSGSEQVSPSIGRERLLLVGNTPDASAQVTVALPAFCIAVESRRPRFPLLRPKRGVYAWKKSGPVKVEQRRYDPKRKQWGMIEVDLPSLPGQAIRLTPQTKIRVRLADQQATLVFQR
ncbi:MAG: VWA domain-containing protein [Thermoanaerobaculia bacterium]|nr:VWA domain-containing protein [Thermoanaerobaculia bacterium]